MTANTINYFAFPGMMNMATYMPKISERTINMCIYRMYGITLRELQSKSRKQHLVRMRHCAMYMLRNNTTLFWADIANLYGGRDHSTAIHAYGKVQSALNGFEPELKQIYEELEQAVMAEYVRKKTKFEEHEKV